MFRNFTFSGERLFLAWVVQKEKKEREQRKKDKELQRKMEEDNKLV
jgi:hypothetical protein